MNRAEPRVFSNAEWCRISIVGVDRHRPVAGSAPSGSAAFGQAEAVVLTGSCRGSIVGGGMSWG
jgi:hypothetical protein